MDWTELDRDRYRTTLDDHQVITYRTPGRRRGWTVEIDGVGAADIQRPSSHRRGRAAPAEFSPQERQGPQPMRVRSRLAAASVRASSLTPHREQRAGAGFAGTEHLTGHAAPPRGRARIDDRARARLMSRP